MPIPSCFRLNPLPSGPFAGARALIRGRERSCARCSSCPPPCVVGAAADPCALENLPKCQLPRPGETWQQLQLLNYQLDLAGCVAEHTPYALQAGSPPRIRAQVRAACVGEAVANQVMTEAQAAALSDQLVDQEVAQLTRCLYAPLPPVRPEVKGFPLNEGRPDPAPFDRPLRHMLMFRRKLA